MAQGGGAAAGIIGLVFMAFYLLVMLAMIAGMWKVFEKAGKPGWAALVPFYNIIVMFEISGTGMPWWYALIPLLNIYAAFMVSMGIAKKFGKSDAFGIGLFLASPIFYPMLGFGSAVYNKDA
ncbi:MAG: signal peptidase I [Fibrobacterota bacterium]|nr:signal peptidase I [Fibrobacterota bacterium]QQS07724.1 MAG: signal peptidase I [Fibrobacterota bacterium]